MKILVINSGSSSLKFKLFALQGLTVLASGMIEQIGAQKSHARIKYYEGEGREKTFEKNDTIAEHREAIMVMADLLRESGAMDDIRELAGIGHRVVHGGEFFHEPVRVDDTVIDAIEELIPLAPLHNPANLIGIRVAMEHAGTVPQVAVFDTAFHQSIPEHCFLYGLPYQLYREQKVRRYGFHGTSHGYVARMATEYLQRPLQATNVITLHLGNGASAAAIQGGKCIETSMGMTPLEGLIMGTRSGDLDPAILFYLARETGMSIQEMDDLLNQESGLKGICGENDMRTITTRAEQGDKQTRLALQMFCHRLKKYIGAYMAVLGGAHCLVFTGGIGENSPLVRKMACEGLDRMGIVLSTEKNNSRENGIFEIQTADSAVHVLVVPTNEELEIAVQTVRLVTQ